MPDKTQTLAIAVHEPVQAGQGDVAVFLLALISLACIAVPMACARRVPARNGRRLRPLP